LLDEEGMDFSARRITISTSGIVPRIYDLGRDVPIQLAISLNATTDEVRDIIMPINKKWPIHELIQSMRDYPLQNRRRITVEYVLLQGINDSLDDAQRLIHLLEDIPVKINILPLNPHDKTSYLPPSAETTDLFQAELRRHGYHTMVRRTRGDEISAACGQLGETALQNITML
jgi:23S rRNA (adenine2503-C2)-methyltransferase